MNPNFSEQLEVAEIFLHSVERIIEAMEHNRIPHSDYELASLQASVAQIYLMKNILEAI